MYKIILENEVIYHLMILGSFFDLDSSENIPSTKPYFSSMSNTVDSIYFRVGMFN